MARQSHDRRSLRSGLPGAIRACRYAAPVEARLIRMRFGLVYLALVPVFALALTLLPPDSLHDTNTGFERSTVRGRNELGDDFTAAVRDRLPEKTPWRWRGRTYFIPRNSLRIVEVFRPEGEQITVELEGQFVGHGETRTYRVPISLSFSGKLTAEGPEPKIAYPAEPGPERASDGPRPPLPLLLPPPVPVKPGSEATYLAVPKQVDAMLQSHRQAAEGDPYYASGRYWRMLYISATTITTLGLGDVTPVTDEARLLVGVEALLGIVTIGLFLNDLAKTVRARRGSDTEEGPPDAQR